MVVTDASVVYKWFWKETEELAKQALDLLQNHLHHKQPIIAPDIILYELTNTWTTKTNLPNNQIKTFLADLEDTKITIESATFSLMKKAAAFSKKYHVSVYEASYVVLA